MTATAGRRRRRAALSLVLLGGLALAACTPPGGETEPTPEPTPSATETATPAPTDGESTAGTATPTGQFFRGLPPGVDSVPGSAGNAGAGWSDAERQLYVVTIGSSSCPVIGVGVTSSEGDRITIDLAENGGDACTTDLVPTTSVVEVPGSVSRDDDLVVALGDLGEVTVPAWDGETAVAWLPNA